MFSPVEFKPPKGGKTKALVYAGAVILASSLIFTILSILWWKGFFGERASREKGTCFFYLIGQTNFFADIQAET